MATFIETRHITFVVIDCGECGVQFGLSERFQQGKRESGGTFYCPNGHPRVYRVSELDETREKLANEKRNAEFWRQRTSEARKETEAERRSKAAVKGQLTKVKNRVGHGVCPCCNRSFENLKRHMTSKHPEVVANPEA
jgi:hypothetical protein